MPVGVPKVYVSYDSKGNVIQIHGEKKRVNDDDLFGEKFTEEFGDGDGFGDGFGDDFDEDFEDERVEVEDQEGEKGMPDPDNESEIEKEFNEICESEERFSYRNDFPKNVPFENDDKDDNALAAAEKRKKKEEEDAEEGKDPWYNLFEVLHREGLIFVGREMKMKFANTVVSLLVFLDREDNPNRTPTVFINSPGGFVFAGLAIYDAIELLNYGQKVQTVVIGLAASMASIVLIGGGLRVAFTNARVMIHQPRMKKFENEASEIGLEARILLDLRHEITDIYERKTLTPYSKITADLEHDKFMSAYDARLYGIVDGIVPAKRGDDLFFDEDETF